MNANTRAAAAAAVAALALLATACGGSSVEGRADGGGRSAGSAGGGSVAGAAPPPAGGPEMYEATTVEGRIQLELNPGGAARLTMMPADPAASGMPARATFDLRYTVTGNNVVIEMPGEGPTELVRAGSDLVMTANGETARFVRQ